MVGHRQLAERARYLDRNRAVRPRRNRRALDLAIELRARVCGPAVTGISHFGPFVSDAGVTFRLWAPAAKTASVLLDGVCIDMPKQDGWFELLVAEAKPGTRYRFRIDDE